MNDICFLGPWRVEAVRYPQARTIEMSRRFGRSIGQARVVDHVPLSTPQCLTVLHLCAGTAARPLRRISA